MGFYNEYTELKMYPDYLLMYHVPPRLSHARYVIKQERTNTKGSLSETSKRKLKRAISNLLLISDWQKRYDDQGIPYKFKINFITLKLTAMQIHTDKEMKAFLNDWIKVWQKKGLKSYVWKAEKQKNGNIHFHFTTNFYIHHSDIRNSWNNILRRTGYIAKYRSNQLEWHKNGFKERKDVKRKIKGVWVKWTRSQQMKAYKQGMSENWSNPNSTDVRGVKHVNNLSAYLIKYLCKDSSITINGRLWSCSRDLLTKPDTLDKVECHATWEYHEHPKALRKAHFWILPRRYIQSAILDEAVNRLKHRILKSEPESCALELTIDPFQGQLKFNLVDLPPPSLHVNENQLSFGF